MKSILSKKVRLGRISVPVWTSVLTLAAVAMTAGQAVGPVLAGSVTGTVGLTVEQAITLDTDTLGENPSVDAPNGGDIDWVSTFNDEGTEFTVAVEMFVGQRIELNLDLVNDSGVSGAAMLELNVPAGIDVELDRNDDGSIEEAQASRNTWLMVVPDGTSETYIQIEPKDNVAPGFYTISGRIVQISG
jgi:hypothetical protein